MKVHSWFPLVLCCSLMLNACSARQPEEQRQLPGSSWKVTSLNDTVIPVDTVATLMFAANGRLAGKAFCNNYMAQYQLMDKKLKISQIASTKMACEPSLMRLQSRFLGILYTVTDYSILPDGNLLILGTGNKKVIAQPVTP